MVEMDGSKMSLRSLTMDQLTGVINLYPWFGAARKELCARMAKVGGSEWGKAQYSDAALYVASRSLISDIVRSTRMEDYSDKDVERLIKEYINPAVSSQPAQGQEYSDSGQSSVAAGSAESAVGTREYSSPSSMPLSEGMRIMSSPISGPSAMTSRMAADGRIRSWDSAPRLWPRFTPIKAILLRQRRFIRDLSCDIRKKVLTLHPLLKICDKKIKIKEYVYIPHSFYCHRGDSFDHRRAASERQGTGNGQ